MITSQQPKAKKWLKEPLVQFVLGGLLLVLLDQLILSSSFNQQQIKVDNNALLTYQQAKEKSFNAELAQTKLNKLTDDEFAQLKQDYIADEVMYKEALAFGLDQYDYVIRQRLIQKMQYLLLDEQPEPITEDALLAWFDSNKVNYRQEPTISFTHIFFGTQLHNEQRSEQQAVELAKQTLNQIKDKPNLKTQQYGERFYFQRDYAKRSKSFVSGHFGKPFTQTLFDAPTQQWFGPINSEYGAHLVLVQNKTSVRTPKLSEVASQVLADYQRQLRASKHQQVVEKLKLSYQIIDNTQDMRD